MSYEPRRVEFLGLEGRIKHYGIGLHGASARAALADATAAAAAEVVPGEAYGFTIAHDTPTLGMGLVYWWANGNEIHQRIFLSPGDDPGALAEHHGPEMACVWELEVIDFERRAWLEDVLKAGDPDAYLARALSAVEV